jgi:hypothetical protein
VPDRAFVASLFLGRFVAVVEKERRPKAASKPRAQIHVPVAPVVDHALLERQVTMRKLRYVGSRMKLPGMSARQESVA